jgi:hypothetical protein
VSVADGNGFRGEVVEVVEWVDEQNARFWGAVIV